MIPTDNAHTAATNGSGSPPRAPDVGLDTSAGPPPRVSVGLVAIEAESERDRDKRRRQRTLFDGIAERLRRDQAQ